MEKTVYIGGRPVKFRATAAIPRLYRIKFRKDIMQDMAALSAAYDRVTKDAAGKTDEEKSAMQFSVTDLTLFENTAYIMAKHADPDGVPATIEEWLDGFETFDIYQVLPELLELWSMNTESLSNPKKNRP